MNYPFLKACNLVVGLGLVISVTLPISAGATDGAAHKPTAQENAAAQNPVAAGAVEDTLQACMTRIPKDASLGQRLIAEKTCMRDDNERKLFQQAPSR